jgi:hypothetical protein
MLPRFDRSIFTLTGDVTRHREGRRNQSSKKQSSK